MKHSFTSKPWLILQLVLMLVGTAFTMTSCGDDDEPQGTVIDYYLNVEEEFLVNGSTSLISRYQNPKERMMNAIRKVYPKANAEGADIAVIEACEKEYQAYREMYAEYPDHLTCLFRLVRVVKKGDLIRQSEDLRIFVYDINSTATDIED